MQSVQRSSVCPLQDETRTFKENRMKKQAWLVGGALMLAAVPLAGTAHSDVKYTEETKMETPSGRGGRGRPPADTGPKGTGKMIITTDAQDLGEEEVAGVKTRHWMMSVRTQSSGCAGDADATIKMEVWTAPGITGAAPCPVKSQT